MEAVIFIGVQSAGKIKLFQKGNFGTTLSHLLKVYFNETIADRNLQNKKIFFVGGTNLIA